MKFSTVLRALPLILVCIALTACEKPEEKEARYLKRGNALFEQGSYAKARLEYKNAEQIMPNDAEPRYRLGLVDEAEGDPSNAFANYIGAEQQNAHYHPALLKLAQYFIAVNEYQEADHRLNIVLAETPDDAQGHALRAAILLRRKDYDGTEKEARIAMAADPANITAAAVLAGLYSAQNNEAKAIATLDESIARNPEDVTLLLLKVMVYEQNSNLAKTAEAYQAVFKLKPQEEVFRADLAKIYVKSGKLDDAERTLREGIAAMPDNLAMKKDLVVFLGDYRSVDTAEQEIRSLMQAHPKNDELYFWLADLYISHNATDRAATLLEQIIARDDSDRFALSARTSLARIQFVKGNRELAEKLVNAVLEKDPGNPDALLIRAQMAFDQGRYQASVSDLRSILRDNPKDRNAVQLLAETLLLQGHVDLAIDTQSQLVDLDPADTSAIVRLGQMYLMNGNPDRALELFDHATKTAPDFSVGWESTARAALSLKDWARAAQAIATLDKLQGQHMVALFLQGQLLDLSGKPADAIPLYTQVFNADLSSPLAEHALTAFVEAKQRLNQLQSAVDTLASLKPGNSYVTSLLAGCLAKLGRDAEAEATFNRAIAEGATSASPYLGLSELYLKAGKPEQALDVLTKATQLNPSDIRPAAISANTLNKLGRYKEAIALYSQILDSHPGTDAIANNLAQLIADHEYEDSAALERARQIAERFADSTNPVYLDTLGWVYYRQGNLQLAETIMERAISDDKNSLPPEAHYHYGSLLLKLGKKEEAKAELQQAMQPGADYSGRDDARDMLNKL